MALYSLIYAFKGQILLKGGAGYLAATVSLFFRLQVSDLASPNPQDTMHRVRRSEVEHLIRQHVVVDELAVSARALALDDKEVPAAVEAAARLRTWRSSLHCCRKRTPLWPPYG